jgi:hypothetical protein
MKRRYRIKNTRHGYMPQVKYGWLPWFDVGSAYYLFGEGAKKACDRHNASKDRGGSECEKYIPEPFTNGE